MLNSATQRVPCCCAAVGDAAPADTMNATTKSALSVRTVRMVPPLEESKPEDDRSCPSETLRPPPHWFCRQGDVSNGIVVYRTRPRRDHGGERADKCSVSAPPLTMGATGSARGTGRTERAELKPWRGLCRPARTTDRVATLVVDTIAHNNGRHMNDTESTRSAHPCRSRTDRGGTSRLGEQRITAIRGGEVVAATGPARQWAFWILEFG